MFACHGKVYALANEQFKRQWSSQGGAICYHCTTKNGHLREHHCPFCCPVRSYARRQCQLSSCAASPQASQHDQLKPMKPALPRHIVAPACCFMTPVIVIIRLLKHVQLKCNGSQVPVESLHDHPSCYMTHGDAALLVAICRRSAMMCHASKQVLILSCPMEPLAI
jgi:hypothetical protein